MSVYIIGSAATGAVFLSRYYCIVSRMIGVALVAVSFFLITSPAWADQTVMAADGSQVDCAASAKDLTRISLVEDEFASVSKISTGNPQDDFSVVNEPVRGDIYPMTARLAKSQRRRAVSARHPRRSAPSRSTCLGFRPTGPLSGATGRPNRASPSSRTSVAVIAGRSPASCAAWM